MQQLAIPVTPGGAAQDSTVTYQDSHQMPWKSTKQTTLGSKKLNRPTGRGGHRAPEDQGHSGIAYQGQ